ncbi:HlyD family efflux transporter periplasmic adaptor subunit [Patescibacteria group bacterium]|nr:HlyD family efflux transporter periplasmic adaptor subunit [Patescibacteria group bacterium]MDE1946272.1 HlyD family efflux transporter periplasmic adaptor subunit [Patescibacteria group bacterium]MDE2010724.1 HlyD family efflux transporter periplasmic adaptor subunit [Patescibacteria group bacterium]MDE2232608.1 HlyD family efflux transporter periplasmic adaptor subunit [Patescibacteria group bacterium]
MAEENKDNGIETENKPKESVFRRLTKNIWVTSMLVGVIVLGGAAGIIYWAISSQRIYTDNAVVEAPVASIMPAAPGVLNKVFVNVGDVVPANTVVAQVGNELLKTKTAGEIVDANTAIGSLVSPQTVIVKEVDPGTLRVVATIDEDKGLSDIKIGDQAIFTVDAFGSKSYQGVVDEISPTARQGDIVFNISDKRPTNQFDVKIRFNTIEYPELKNGMSAKVWIYKQ